MVPDSKESTYNMRELHLDSELRQFPGGGHGNPLQYTHSSILTWRIPKNKGACILQSMTSQRVRHNWATKHLLLNIINLSLLWSFEFMNYQFCFFFQFWFYLFVSSLLLVSLAESLSIVFILWETKYFTSLIFLLSISFTSVLNMNKHACSALSEFLPPHGQ